MKCHDYTLCNDNSCMEEKGLVLNYASYIIITDKLKH